MFLNAATLEVSFRVKYGERSYMVYASTGNMKCLECGDVVHKRATYLHKNTELQVEINRIAEASLTVAPLTVEEGVSTPTAVSDAGEGSSDQNKQPERDDTEKTEITVIVRL